MMEKWYNVNQVAEKFQVDPQTVRIWLRDGKLKGTRLGERGRWRVTESALINFANEKYS
jgi:excisionase family DNA binding protein